MSASTTLPPSNIESIPGKALGNYRTLALRSRLGIIGLGFGVACLLVTIFVLNNTLNSERAVARVFVLDRAGTVHSGPLAKLADEPEFFRRLAMRAAVAAFSRSASADSVVFDNVEEVELMFGEQARGLLNAEVSASAKEFITQQISQKPLVSNVRILKESGGQRLISVAGRLERTGSFDGRPRRFYVNFKCVFAFAPNQRLELTGDYPYVVTDLRTALGDTTISDEK